VYVSRAGQVRVCADRHQYCRGSSIPSKGTVARNCIQQPRLQQTLIPLLLRHYQTQKPLYTITIPHATRSTAIAQVKSHVWIAGPATLALYNADHLLHLLSIDTAHVLTSLIATTYGNAMGGTVDGTLVYYKYIVCCCCCSACCCCIQL
jgi:hypothetical protein